MTKFLKNKYRLVFLLVIIINLAFGIVPPKVSGLTNSTYYKSLISDWRIKNTEVLTTFDVTQEKIDLNLLDADFVIIVCSEEFNYENRIKCMRSSVSLTSGASENETINLGDVDLTHLSIATVTRSDATYIFIPEDYFVIPSYRDKLRAYFQSLRRSADVVSGSLAEVQEDQLPKEDLFNSVLTEIALYTLFILFMFSLFYRLLVDLVNKPSDFLKFETYRRLYQGFFSKVSTLSRYLHDLFVPIVFSLLIATILIFLILSIRDTSTPDISYAYKYVTSILKPQNIGKVFSKGSVFRKLLLGYFFLLGGSIAILTLSDLPQLISVSAKKLFGRKIKESGVKYLIPLMVVFSLVVSLIFGLIQTYIIILATLVVVLYLIYVWDTSKTSKYKYSRREQFIFIGGFIVIALLMSIFFKNDAGSSSYDVAEEDLIGVKDNIVLLPYDKYHPKYVIFKDHMISGQHPIFVDDFLVYHPDFKFIQNKNIKDFSSDENFYILKFGSAEIKKEIATNTTLLQALTGGTKGRTFYIENLETTLIKNNYSIELEVECRVINKPVNVDVRYTVKKGTSATQKKETLIYFPGCLTLENSATYGVPISFLDDLKADLVLMELMNIDRGIRSVKLFLNNQKQPLQFINEDNIRMDEVYFLERKKGDKIVVYSHSLMKEISLNRVGETQNISEVLNRFGPEGNLRNPFRIWSVDNGVIVKNDFVN